MLVLCWFWASLELQEVMHVDLMPYEIFSAVPFAVGEDGAFVLCDRDNGQLLFLDKKAQNPRRVASQGQGPGEFQAPVSIQWIPAEQAFAVADFGNRRLSFWSASGELVREAPYPGGTVFFFRFSCSGNLIFSRDPAGHFEGKPKLGLFDLTSNSETVLWSHPLEKPMAVTAVSLAEGSIARLLRWDPRLVYGIGSDFVAVAWSESSKIHLVDMNGHNVGKPFAADLPRRPVTSEDVEQQVDDFDQSYREQIKPNMVMRDYWPAMSSIVVDNYNRIWVFGFSDSSGEAVDFRIFDKNGKCLGTGQMAEVPAVINNNEIIYIREDEEENVSLVKLQYSF